MFSVRRHREEKAAGSELAKELRAGEGRQALQDNALAANRRSTEEKEVAAGRDREGKGWWSRNWMLVAGGSMIFAPMALIGGGVELVATGRDPGLGKDLVIAGFTGLVLEAATAISVRVSFRKQDDAAAANRRASRS